MRVTRYGYDENGRRNYVRSPRGLETITEYDAAGRATATIRRAARRGIPRLAKTEQRRTLMRTAQDSGMITMDKSPKLLYQKGLISYDDALAKARYPESFEHI